MKTNFKPLSEIVIPPMTAVSEGEIFGDFILEKGERRILERLITVQAGESKTLAVKIVVPDGAECVIRVHTQVDEGATWSSFFAVEVSGSGVVRLVRTANVVGARAQVHQAVRGLVREKAQVFVDDDLNVTGPEADVAVCTKLVLDNEALSQVRARIIATVPSTVDETLAHLLLSDRAKVQTIPELEVRHCDVRASHRASVIQPSLRQRAYLLARGLSLAETDRIIAEGFLQ